jgi:hypothetical protein
LRHHFAKLRGTQKITRLALDLLGQSILTQHKFALEQLTRFTGAPHRWRQKIACGATLLICAARKKIITRRQVSPFGLATVKY